MGASLALKDSIKAALLAAVVAALLASVWHQVLSVPLFDRPARVDTAVDASMNGLARAGGLTGRTSEALGLVLYGVTWALVLGGVFGFAQRRLSDGSQGRRATLLVLAAGWAVSILPFLCYPHSPPGVGDVAIVQARQWWYFATIVLATLGAIGALLVGRRLRTRPANSWSWRNAWRIALVDYALVSLLLLMLLPSRDFAAPAAPALVVGFQLIAFIGLLVFWIAFALLFGMLVKHWSIREQEPASGADGSGTQVAG